MGNCCVLINILKWNEVYGNVVVEVLVCGVLVVVYDCGGLGELICLGCIGWLVFFDDVVVFMEVFWCVDSIECFFCCSWVEEYVFCEVFS